MIYGNLIETEIAKLTIKCFFDEITNTATYLIADTVAKECAIIDSVLGFELSTGTTSNELADDMIDYLTNKQWQCRWILETHAHADHLTAAPYLQSKLGGKIAIGLWFGSLVYPVCWGVMLLRGFLFTYLALNKYYCLPSL
jgi:glyoxylase-like metal-dependent hydrolase (beta-lactamase superfamily II)